MARPVALLAALGLLLTGCQRWPDSYPPPEQLPTLPAPPMTSEPAILEFSGHHVDEHIVRDIWLGYSPVPWRWTEKRPTVKLMVHGTVGLKFIADFTVPAVTFKDTGPVNIRFLVNGQQVGTVRVTSAGQHHFEKPVYDSWLTPGEENQLGAEIDRLWIDPSSGAPYGFILSMIGLTRI